MTGFGISKEWFDAQDQAQDAIEAEVASLRRFAKTAQHHEALDELLDQAKQTRTRINFRRQRVARASMMLG
jgi:hypothetical protein